MFLCDKCGASFTRNDNLKRHQKLSCRLRSGETSTTVAELKDEGMPPPPPPPCKKRKLNTATVGGKCFAQDFTTFY